MDPRDQPLNVEVIALFGPTAAGKSAVAEHLADAIGTEVVSADAMQVYRGIPIITNQPDRPTRLVAIRDLSEEMSVGEFAAVAHEAIDDLVALHGIAVLSGGSGLYFRAALQDLRIPAAPAPGLRAEVERRYDDDPAGAYEQLTRLDPAAGAAIHPNDRRRVVRALELAASGDSLRPARDELWAETTRRPTMVFGLDLPPGILEARIRERAAGMVERGAIVEARHALSGSISRTAEKALGLRELAELEHDEALDRLVLRTRRYAAYQRKWMRRMPGIRLLDGTRSVAELAADILALARVVR